MAITDQPRLIGLAIAESVRRLRRNFLGGAAGGLGLPAQAPERLVLAPRDLATADPTVAQDIYAGVYHFAGRSANSTGISPFLLDPPSRAWQQELHSFGWLRHLSAAGDAVSAQNAQALVRDWIQLFRAPSRHPAWEVETASRRLIAWLCNSVPIVQDADIADYRRFLRSIGQHVRYLRRRARYAPDGMPRLLAHIALGYAAACATLPKLRVATIWRNLDQELKRQIYPDGGHIARNPGVLPDILALLLPLRESLLKIGQAPSHEFLSAIDRIALAIRFFRLGDGSIARFNGASATPTDLIATVSRYDESPGGAPASAGFSGYQRLANGDTVLIVDVGRPPRGELSVHAHAGTLAFEMSSGVSSIVVNCGAPPVPEGAASVAARSTAAHSTLVLNDHSSCRFNIESALGRYLESRIISGPRNVRCKLETGENSRTVKAVHDGYLRRFGLLHRREITLADAGATVMGSDRLFRPGSKPIRANARDTFAIRFHLHPLVSATWDPGGRDILLQSPNATWIFTCVDVEPLLEDSIFFAVASGSRATQQIVLPAAIAEHSEVRWMFRRLDTGNTAD
jgi:uncharacterized heparinase superfamily protein